MLKASMYHLTGLMHDWMFNMDNDTFRELAKMSQEVYDVKTRELTY